MVSEIAKNPGILLKITTGNSTDVIDTCGVPGYLKVYWDSSANNGKPGEVEFCLSEDC